MGQRELFLACFGMAAVDRRQITHRRAGGDAGLATRCAFAPTSASAWCRRIARPRGCSSSSTVSSTFRCRWWSGFAVLASIDNGGGDERRRRRARSGAVDRRALYTPAGAFSGGNQQKIVIAKWLLAESRILLLFDPTRGVDVGTKHEIYCLMRAFRRCRRCDPFPFHRDPGDRAPLRPRAGPVRRPASLRS